MIIVMRNIIMIIMIGYKLVIYCQDTVMVDKILYLATKAGVHIIDTYLCICLVTDNIQSVANVMSL